MYQAERREGKVLEPWEGHVRGKLARQPPRLARVILDFIFPCGAGASIDVQLEEFCVEAETVNLMTQHVSRTQTGTDRDAVWRLDSPAVKPSASRCSVVAASCCAPGCKGRNTVDCKLTLHMCQVPAQVNGGGVTALGRLAKKTWRPSSFPS
ncbi:uncharacterized protein LOC126996561 isoform X2 [Eriocheir sinensis]|uniref:uncharacterized protein LOC126996561 isoform X2 n=1 Tax=Eriocheir sinensis TaxID=95602 RepID=UPI0021C8B191|nr:uncharacterized protein LOC126996561 isoform X2 [Eriocheir sinensis]XP_050713129.1 uncharacterized protein LOC126996561 isoform X2 [Eriocheir sinensis]